MIAKIHHITLLLALSFWACKSKTPSDPNAEAEAAASALHASGAALPAAALVLEAADTAVPESKASATEVFSGDAPDLDYLMGKFDPAKHPNFVKVAAPYTTRDGMFLRKEVLDAFKKMHEAAKKDGVTLQIISSTRTFTQQKNIWETKWGKLAKEQPDAVARARKILEFSSMPGTSRHHWGTDIDLNDLNNRSFEAGGQLEKNYAWLAKNADKFGFCQPYTPKGAARPDGYNEEKWHWTYTPISKKLLAEYLKFVNNTLIQGFKGAETAKTIDAVGKYAGGINKDCQ